MADERKRREDPEQEEAPKKEEKKKKKKKGEEPETSKEERPSKKDKSEKPEKNKKDKKEKKGHPALKAFFITSLIWLTALFVFSALTFFNFFYLKETVLQLLNPEEDFEVMFANEIAILNEFEEDLNQREAELDIFEFELDDREAALDDREFLLEEREFELEEKYPWVFDDDAQEIDNPFDISDVAKAVAAMPPQRAASAMLGMDMDGALKIMNAMRPAEYGAILSQMTDEDASSFLDAMTESE